MAEKDINSHIFDEEDSVLDLNIKTEIRFSKKNLPKGEMVPVFVDGKKEYVLIPLDVKDGTILTVSGGGKRNPRSGQNGDLHVMVHIIEEKGLVWKKILLPVIGVVAIACLLVILLMNKPREQVQVTPLPTKPAQTASVCVHDWIPADCDNPKICRKCEEESGFALGHNFTEATYNDPQICMACGIERGEKKTPTIKLGLQDIVSGAQLSSTYSSDNLGLRKAEDLYDGNLKTNWTEGVSGYGEGEYVVFYFKDTYAVNKLFIWIGSHFSTEALYKQNGRPSVITLTFSDGSTERINLEDSMEMQEVEFEKFYYTDSIMITIDEVYKGTQYPDTIIAELDFVAYKP